VSFQQCYKTTFFQDTSPLSNYVMHPFWNNVVKIFPRWIAPNLLTLTGFLFSVSQTVLLSVVDPGFSLGGSVNTIPRWVWYYSAFSHFMAHTLDGIDGKQARRTGSSSPLGEMFDHGLDSWSTSLFVINMYSGMLITFFLIMKMFKKNNFLKFWRFRNLEFVKLLKLRIFLLSKFCFC